jgi:hypothetical protein
MSLDRVGRGGQYRYHRQRRRSQERTLPPWLISSACPRGCSAVSLSLPGSSPCRFIAFETEDNIDITSDGSHRRQDQPRRYHRDQDQGHILTDRGFRSMLIETLNSCPNLKVINVRKDQHRPRRRDRCRRRIPDWWHSQQDARMMMRTRKAKTRSTTQ